LAQTLRLMNMCLQFRDRTERIKSTEIGVDFERIAHRASMDFSLGTHSLMPTVSVDRRIPSRTDSPSQSPYYRNTYQQDLSEELLTAVI